MPATMVRGCGFADIDVQVQQLVGALDGSADLHQPTRRSTLTKSSMAICGRPLATARRRAAAPSVLPSSACWRRTPRLQLLHLFDGGFRVDARENRRDCADLLARRASGPSADRPSANCRCGLRACRAAPRSSPRIRGSTGYSRRGDDAQRLGGGVKSVDRARSALAGRLWPVSRAPARRCTCPRRRSSAQMASRRLENSKRSKASRALGDRAVGVCAMRGDRRRLRESRRRDTAGSSSACGWRDCPGRWPVPSCSGPPARRS